MMNRIEKEIKIADIITRQTFSEEEITEEEKEMLQEWLEESEKHREWLRKVREELPYGEFEKVERISDAGEQWQRLEYLTRESRRVGWRKWGAYAAGIALLVSLGLWFGLRQEETKNLVVKMANVDLEMERAFLILNDGNRIELRNRDTLVEAGISNININSGQVKYDVKDDTTGAGLQEEYNSIVIPRGGIYSLILSDGTRVYLNSESELRYPVRFMGKEREVELKGEAFFEVKRDPSCPFVVRTGEMKTRVLGTSFNVFAYADEPLMETTLFSGRVEVAVNGEGWKVLEPGMQASWGRKEGDNIIVKKVNLELQSCWRDGIFVLMDDELESVMRMLSRWYNVTYEFKGDRSVKHTFTGKIDRNEDLETVLRTLTFLGGPRFEIVDKKVYIY